VGIVAIMPINLRTIMEHATATETTTTTIDNDLMIMSGHLAAIAMFAAKKDIRSYLIGVCIDTGPQGTFLVATCGHTVAVHQIDTVARPAGQLIMPLAPLASMIKANRRVGIKLTLPADFSGKYDNNIRVKRQITLESLKGEISIVSEMDGIFPDWRRVARYDDAPFPKQVFFNPHYLVQVADAADLISKRKFAVQVRPGGIGVGFATLDHEGKTVAYIMPFRSTIDDLPSKPNMTY
jgi:DNA polymerase-3 subunit beta